MIIPSLNYHRRHTGSCIGGHPKRSWTSEPEERRKGWTRCKCPIYASGSLNRIAERVNTKQVEWSAAAVVMAPYIAANSWTLPEGTPPPMPPKMPVPAGEGSTGPGKGVSISTAAERYLKEHESLESAQNTIRQKRYLLEDLKAFSQAHGVAEIQEWTMALVKERLATWEIGATTRNRKWSGLKAFFEYCVGEEWITINPARYKIIRNRATKKVNEGKQVFPFTDRELERMYDGCREWGMREIRERPKRKGTRVVESINRYREYKCKWSGEDFLDFIAVSVYTGLRISDVSTFHIERLLPSNECHVRTIKGDTKVYTVLPPWLATRLRERARLYGPLIFGAHDTKDINCIADQWRRRLKKLWEANGPWDMTPHPHRFRHTFIRVLLESGTPVAKVAELVGDKTETIMKYYSAWVPGRQQQLSAILREAFADTPNPYKSRRVVKQG